MSKSKAVVR